MEGVFQKQVRPLLDIIDRLREIGLQNEISLPQIVVMGDQSSGKSSVLESISGIPFPRGSGLVTRCPTQLIMSKSDNDDETWKAEISINWNNPQPEGTGIVKSLSDLQNKMKIMAKIITDNSPNGFSDDSIVIRLSSPDSPDLTLIDLPGIVRTSVLGQDVKVVQQVNQMINSYIQMPNTIILAVIPSNQDIATIDILERAATIDPDGKRTIGVLTKPDLIGPGNEEEVEKVLLNIRKPLTLGYIMVKNLSQKQLNEGVSLQQSRQEEMKYFSSHEVFSKYLNNNILGFDKLISSLTKLLVENIKSSLPHMIFQVKNLLNEAREELIEIGDEIDFESDDQQSLLMKKLLNYCQVLRHSVRGEYRDEGGILSKNEDFRLHYKVRKIYRLLQERIVSLRPVINDVFKPELLERLENEMRNQKGRDMPGFLNTQAFYSFIIDLVEEWRPLIEECKSDVVNLTQEVSSALLREMIKEFPSLGDEVQQIISNLIESTAIDVGYKLEALIVREQDPFTTQDALQEIVNGNRFRTYEHILRQILESIDVNTVGENIPSLREEVKNILGNWYMTHHGVDAQGVQEEMKTLIKAYWDISSRRLIDNICMCIEMDFSNSFIKELESKCVLYGISLDKDKIKDLLREDFTITEKRKHLKQRISVLQKSHEILHQAFSGSNLLDVPI